jgi:hypothetical protein
MNDLKRKLRAAKPLFTPEQREKARAAMIESEAALMEKYGRLIYCAPPEELKRIEDEWTAHKAAIRKA